MLDPKFGTIKFFNSSQGKMFGFIKPDEPRSDGRDVFFHRNNACWIYEDRPGGLDMQLESWVKREPRKGDRVVYFDVDHSKGPTAFQWNYEDQWKKAKGLIDSRPRAEWPLCRVVRQDPETFAVDILWEGYYPHLIELLTKGTKNFLQDLIQDKDDWYHNTWCEEFLVQGWGRMWNPLDTGLMFYKLGFEIDELDRQLLQNFPPNTVKRELSPALRERPRVAVIE